MHVYVNSNTNLAVLVAHVIVQRSNAQNHRPSQLRSPVPRRETVETGVQTKTKYNNKSNYQYIEQYQDTKK